VCRESISEVCDLGACVCKPDVQCTSDLDCPQGYYCDLELNECVEETCVPQCEGKCCGTNGCGGTCPNNCPGGYVCNMGTCQCELDQTCSSDSQCPTMHCCRDGSCIPAACGNMQCGYDYVCEFSCGTCPAGSTQTQRFNPAALICFIKTSRFWASVNPASR